MEDGQEVTQVVEAAPVVEVQEVEKLEVSESEEINAESEIADLFDGDGEVWHRGEEEAKAETVEKGGEEEKPSEQETTEKPTSVEAELRAQIAELMQSMQALQNKAAETAATSPEPLKLPENPSDITTVDFLGGEDPADFLTEPVKFNQLLNTVATVAARAAVASAKESTLRAIPEIVQRSTQQQSEINKSVDSFYSANPDLVPFKNMVSMAATQIYSTDATLKLEDILSGAAVKVRELLKLRKTQVNVTPAQPVAAGSAGAKRPTPFTLSDEQMQIAELFG